MSAETDKTPAPEPKPKMRRRRKAAIGLVSLALLVVVLLVGFAVLLVLRSEPLAAPQWLQERIEREIARAASPYDVRLGQASVVIEDGWEPRILLGDTAVFDAAGAQLASFDALSMGLALRPLFEGEAKPIDIALSGTRFGVRRDEEGAFWLSFDEALGGSDAQDAGFAELMQALDQVLALDAFSAFERLEIGDVTLRYSDQRARRTWTVDGGRLDVQHLEGNLRARADFSLLTGGASAAGMEMTFERSAGSRSAFIGMNLSDFPASDLATQSAALSWLEALSAPISGALRVSLDDAGRLGPLSATLQIGEGALKPNAAAKPVPFEAARVYLTYQPDTGIIQFDEISLESEWVSLTADGKLGLVVTESGWPEAFVGQLKFGSIAASPTDFLSRTVRFDDGFADLRIALDPFRVELGQLGLREGETQLLAEGSFAALEAGWSYGVQASGRKIEFDKVLELWPEQFSEKTRTWVASNILAGRINEAQFALRADPGERPEPYLSFGFDGVKLRFMKTMPVLEGLAGHASLLQRRFSARATKGRLSAPQGGSLDVAGTEFIIPKTRPKPARAQVNIQANGQITALLSVLDLEPLEFLSKANQPVTLADGRIEVEGRLGWEMRRKVDPKTIQYELKGVARDVRSRTIVPGRLLAMPSVRLQAKDQQLLIEGDGRLGDVPISGRFMAPLGPNEDRVSRVSGRIELSQRFIKEFKIGLPSSAVRGRGQGQIDLELRRGEGPRFSLTSDLVGVALAIPQIGWGKSERNKGQLVVTGQLGAPIRVDDLTLNASGLSAKGSVRLDEQGQFQDAQFTRVTIAPWLDVPLRFVSRGRGRAPLLQISGGRLDLSKTSLGEGRSGGSGSGGPIAAQLDELKISEGISLRKFSGDFTTSGGFTGNFTGLVNGKAPVSGRIVPQSGRSAFRLQSSDGGAVLKAAGLLKNAQGGNLDLTMAPASAKGSYNGALDMTGVRLKDAPAMAELLNALSVVGLLEQLSGSGILFNEIEARFQLTPERVIVSRSSAVGASMGISMDGYYELGSGAMDMQGVVSPFYLLNGVGQILTRKGEGLVGFNYNLRGTSAQPKVQVNPLSIFTPGMFREIFRRPAPKVER